MNNTGWIVLAVVALLAGGIIGALYFSSTEIVEVEKEKIVEVQVPAENVDNELLAKICELTEGCEFYEGSLSVLSALDSEDAEDDFLDELERITDIDEDDLEFDYDYKDSQVRAYTKQDMKDENWEVKVFVKITYWDADDSDDKDKIYLLITSVLDEGDYESMTVQEVPRSFEFD